MPGQSHASQNVGEPLDSPDADSQEAILSPNGRTRTVGRFEDATLMWSFEAHIETLKQQLGKAEARAEKQAAEFAERAALVAAEHAAQIKTLAARIETLKAQLSVAETQLAERATEHEAERVKTEAEPLKTEAERAKAARAIREMWERERANRPLKTEAEQAKAARAIALNKELAAEWANRPWWERILRSGWAEIYGDTGGGRMSVSDMLNLNAAPYQPATRDDALPSSSASVGQAADLSGRARQGRGSAERRQWQLPSMNFDRANRPGSEGASRPLGRRP
jgi:hypothetical protein